MAYAAEIRGTHQPVSEAMRRSTRAMLAQARFGLSSDFDGWDGYPPARARFLRALRGAAAGRTAVYAGDSHCAWAGELWSEGTPVALEFAGTSVTSSGADSWLPHVPPPMLEAAYLAAGAPRLRYAQTAHRGWLDVRLSRDAHTVTFRSLSTIGSTDFTHACDVVFEQRADSPHVMRTVPCPAPPSMLPPPMPPSPPALSPITSAFVGAVVGAALSAVGAYAVVQLRTRPAANPVMRVHTPEQQLGDIPAERAAHAFT
jgi:hypothetical protein